MQTTLQKTKNVLASVQETLDYMKKFSRRNDAYNKLNDALSEALENCSNPMEEQTLINRKMRLLQRQNRFLDAHIAECNRRLAA
jgi:predicted DNA-binding protein YlxM (UPF0122 family)